MREKSSSRIASILIPCNGVNLKVHEGISLWFVWNINVEGQGEGRELQQSNTLRALANMSHSANSEGVHNPHWIGEHGEELVNVSKDTVHISAKTMNIIWGNDKRFWQWIKLSKDESCFEVAAELVQVNWMEVTGSLDLTKFSLSPSTTYEILFVIKFKVDAMGWHSSPITFELITPDGKVSRKTEMLESYRSKGNGWHNVHGGEFVLTSNMNGKVKFGMLEVQTDWWKGGMIFEGVIIRPKLV